MRVIGEVILGLMLLCVLAAMVFLFVWLVYFFVTLAQHVDAWPF